MFAFIQFVVAAFVASRNAGFLQINCACAAADERLCGRCIIGAVDGSILSERCVVALFSVLQYVIAASGDNRYAGFIDIEGTCIGAEQRLCGHRVFGTGDGGYIRKCCCVALFLIIDDAIAACFGVAGII